MDDSRAGPTDEEHKGDASLHEVNLIVDKLLAVRGTRQTANMQVREYVGLCIAAGSGVRAGSRRDSETGRGADVSARDGVGGGLGGGGWIG